MGKYRSEKKGHSGISYAVGVSKYYGTQRYKKVLITKRKKVGFASFCNFILYLFIYLFIFALIKRFLTSDFVEQMHELLNKIDHP